MMRFLALILASLACLPGLAHAGEALPKSLRNLDRAYRSGDWVLQCESSQICRILGVRKKSRAESGMRAIVTISRGIEANARFHVRFAFVDDEGMVMPPPAEGARLYSTGLPRMPPPVPLQLGAAEGEAEFPQYRAAREQAWRVVHALQRWPGAELRNRGALTAHMPRGNLARLLRRMEQLQRPMGTQLTPAENSQWMKEYHYTVVRAKPANGPAVPDDVLLSCDTQTHVNYSEGWQVHPISILWIAHCPEGAKIFLQKNRAISASAPADYGPAVSFDVRDTKGRKRPSQDASFDAAKSLLQLTLSQDSRWDCGHRLQLGYTDQGAFGLIEERRMPMCRRIPPAYWPVAWAPTSWKLTE